jgi:hypothetical protein
LAELFYSILKCPKGDSKDWDNPILEDWLESLNAAIESAEEIIIVSLLPAANQPLVKEKKNT